jgi:hypothetical protein
MTHRFFARDGLPLNPFQRLRNEPKASDPGVPKAMKAKLIGLQNLRNYSNGLRSASGGWGKDRAPAAARREKTSA